MSSFEELMNMAKENSRFHHKKIAEKKKLREREEASRLREKEKMLEQQSRQKKHLSEISIKERTLPKPIPRRPLNNINDNLNIPVRAERSSTNIEPAIKKKMNNKGDSTMSSKNNAPLERVEVRKRIDETRIVKNPKSAALLSFEELKKVASNPSDFSKPSILQPKTSSLPIRKNLPPTNSQNALSSHRKPSINGPPLRKPPSEQAISRPNPSMQKRAELPNPTVKKLPKRQLSPPASNKRPNPDPRKIPVSNVALGTRFSKYGPLDNDLPNPRQANSSVRPKSSLMNDRAAQNIRPSANYPESSRNNIIQRPKPLPKPDTSNINKIPQPPKRTIRPEINDRARAFDSRKSFEQNSIRSTNQTIVSRNSSSRIGSQRITEPIKKRKIKIRDDDIDEEYAKNNISSIIGSIFGYDRTKYRDDFSDDDMEVSASRVRAEELRSARLGREEDEIEEALERERLAKLRQRKRQY